jgi:LmbE family N-acetylglucosaminyl deacetylase
MIGRKENTVAMRLMAVLAHPDDESLGFGGTLAKYAADGVDVFLVTATRGEAGRYVGRRPGEEGHPGEVALASIREAELRDAAAALGIREVSFLDYRDQHLDSAAPREAVGRIAQHIRRLRPQVVVTFGADGAYGHPDHIAISQFTAAATVAAADHSFVPAASNTAATHQVSKLYHLAWPASTWGAYQNVFGKLSATVDGVERLAAPHPEWAITTEVDARPVVSTVLRAATCHTSQVSMRERLLTLTAEQLEAMWGRQTFVRVFSLVNGGRTREMDLFDGLI